MNSTDALPIIRSLANGIDPTNGEVLPQNSVYQRPEVVRALFVAADCVERSTRLARRKEDQPAKAGQPWTEDEDRQLLSAFDAGRGLMELAQAHERTQQGVKARLVKYGRLAA